MKELAWRWLTLTLLVCLLPRLGIRSQDGTQVVPAQEALPAEQNTQNAPAQDTIPRFVALDVVVDVGAAPLAAYQVEIRSTSGNASLVGVEGGEPAPFQEAPYYDPKALQGGRVVIAAFTTETPAPSGRLRVARLHFMVEGKPEFTSTRITAATVGGGSIDANIELLRKGS